MSYWQVLPAGYPAWYVKDLSVFLILQKCYIALWWSYIILYCFWILLVILLNSTVLWSDSTATHNATPQSQKHSNKFCNVKCKSHKEHTAKCLTNSNTEHIFSINYTTASSLMRFFFYEPHCSVLLVCFLKAPITLVCCDFNAVVFLTLLPILVYFHDLDISVSRIWLIFVSTVTNKERIKRKCDHIVSLITISMHPTPVQWLDDIYWHFQYPLLLLNP